MRELDFLPAWYPKVRQRRRMIMFQTWGTLILLAGLASWLLLAERNVHARQAELQSISSDLTQSQTDLQRLEDLQRVQRDLGRQMEISQKIGRPIDISHVITTLDQIMPAQMSLLDLTVDTEDGPRASARTLAARAARRSRAGADSQGESRLRFDLHGVAPTDMDLAEFLARLTGKPIFQNVELLFSRERSDRGHVMREFEVAFVMNLGNAGGS